MNYGAPEPLVQAHVVVGFDCGRKPLNRWLAVHALGNQATGRSRTFVLTARAEPRVVVAFYCVSTSVVEHAAASPRAAKGMPKGEPIPAVLLGRLAVDLKHQGRGLGSALLRDAVHRTYTEIARNAGVRVLLVHAKDRDAQAFYLARGFEPSPSDDLHLMLVMQDVQETFGLDGLS